MQSFFPKRGFFGWFNAVFNKVDASRIKEVGADRAAAEWLLRCGANVTWKGYNKPLENYNDLPLGEFRRLKIHSVDATDSCVMEHGFAHFDGLRELKKLKLKNCAYLTDDSLRFLSGYVEEIDLEWLEVSENGNVTERGVLVLGTISSLKNLQLADLRGVKDPESVLIKLHLALPRCDIQWPPYS